MEKFTRAWPSFSLAAFKRLFIGLALVLTGTGLSGCLPESTKETLDFYGRREWDSFKNIDWPGTGRAATGTDGVVLTGRDASVRTLETACRSSGISGRTTTQEGVNDRVLYVDCPGSAPMPKLGERLAPRS